MYQKECELRDGCQLKFSFLLVSFLMVTGCATLGDIEAANEKTQQSLNTFKKESRESQDELGKKIKALSKEIKRLQNKDKQFNRDYEDIIKENQKLRASLLGVTATIQGFLSAEKQRYEEGLRWIENANKTVAAEPAKGPEANPVPDFPSTAIAPSPSSPPGTTGAVAAAASVTEETSPELDVSERPTIKIIEIVIDPPKVERKSKFTVTVKYELEGDSGGPTLKYLEEVVLLKGTLSIQNLKETVERAPGTNSYSQTIEVPAEAPTGVYTIKGIVSSGPVRNSKIKTFMVK